MGAASLLHAGPMVQAVLLILLLGSVASWAIIIHKVVSLWGFARAIGLVEAFAATGSRSGVPQTGLLAEMIDACRGESAGPDAQTERAMALRSVSLGAVRRHETGLPFLATLAASAPFIGLFGTVWGIMRSFTAIAESNDTSLTVVAPGIAEALFATAMGLATAIPAVVAYNLFRASLRRCGHRLNAAAARLARPHAAVGEPSA